MSSDCPEEKGGVIIIPSARRGIHSYRDNNTNINDIMGRYGLNNSNRQNEENIDEQGGDEVDGNALSKMSRQASPLSIRKKKVVRTHSYSQDEDNCNDTDTSVLSKSLPATLPSHLPYSNNTDDDENSLEQSLGRPQPENVSGNVSVSYYGVVNRSDRSQQYTSRSPHQQRLSVSPKPRRQPTSKQSSNTLRNIILLTLLLGIVAIVVHNKFPSNITENHQNDAIVFDKNMKTLQDKYNIDDNTMLKLKIVISTIFSRMDTGSIMLVYNSKTNNFNAVRFEKFTDEVAHTTARYLRNDVSSIQHTVIESSSLDMQEHGELISRYRDEVDKSGVMLVKEIDSVPSELAMAFHYYCDEYEPLVKRSAIFFTLNMANCSNTSDPKSTHAFIEKCLANKWKTVPPENMRPLLTRVVDVVIDVTSVF